MRVILTADRTREAHHARALLEIGFISMRQFPTVRLPHPYSGDLHSALLVRGIPVRRYS
jgi:hypothetical protein